MKRFLFLVVLGVMATGLQSCTEREFEQPGEVDGYGIGDREELEEVEEE